MYCDFPLVEQPRQQSSWGQHGTHLGPVGPRWAPCWPHGSCYHGGFYNNNDPIAMYTGTENNNNRTMCKSIALTIITTRQEHSAAPKDYSLPRCHLTQLCRNVSCIPFNMHFGELKFYKDYFFFPFLFFEHILYHCATEQNINFE